jgi:hypothetical protein
MVPISSHKRTRANERSAPRPFVESNGFCTIAAAAAAAAADHWRQRNNKRHKAEMIFRSFFVCLFEFSWCNGLGWSSSLYASVSLLWCRTFSIRNAFRARSSTLRCLKSTVCFEETFASTLFPSLSLSITATTAAVPMICTSHAKIRLTLHGACSSRSDTRNTDHSATDSTMLIRRHSSRTQAADTSPAQAPATGVNPRATLHQWDRLNRRAMNERAEEEAQWTIPRAVGRNGRVGGGEQ